MVKLLGREIKETIGRYIALLLIIALGVGFFAGLKVTDPAMREAMYRYLTEQSFYDFRLISTLGFEEEDIEYLRDGIDARYVEPSISFDILMDYNESTYAIKSISIPEKINVIVLEEGQLPTEDNECLVDSHLFDASSIGDVIEVSSTNESDDSEHFKYQSYRIVGLVKSPLFIQYERGSTALGSGVLDGFMYINEDGFDTDVYTDCYVKLDSDLELYSDEYDTLIESVEDDVEAALDIAANNRYERIVDEAQLEYAQKEIADAQAEIDDIEEASTYLLGRDSNVGYVCFESDSTIVGSIANVFPIFFFLVAALVCMTTMNRMVEDQRTQIGVLKALGYSNTSIMAIYVLYSGTAALIGAAVGFIAGTVAFPKAIWYAYQMMYNAAEVSYYFSPSMLIISFVVAFICSVGVTILSCRFEMKEMAASLMRPKAPRAGKRILLEYIPIFWDRLKFLMKISLRNIFRYKARLIMMVLGIGGCTALLVAGFGIYDSIADIAVNQYTNISKYDMDITLKDEAGDKVIVIEDLGYSRDDYLLFYHTSVDLKFNKNTKNVYLNVFESDADLDSFYDMHDSNGNHINFSDLGDDEAIINESLCDRYGIKLGDTITISSDSIEPTQFRVAAINENFINNFIYISEDGFKKNIEETLEKKNVYLNINESEDAHEVVAKLMDKKGVTSVTATVDMLDRVDNMMQSLNIIVYLVIGCAMALSAVVVYNLTNINIAERTREIATVKVLGFYREETKSYVFRENIMLSVMGAAVGLLLGKLLHAFIMSEIVVDLITFDVRITAVSYLIAFALTVVFTYIIDLFMTKHLDDISMTESLKAVE